MHFGKKNFRDKPWNHRFANIKNMIPHRFEILINNREIFFVAFLDAKRNELVFVETKNDTLDVDD